MKQRTMQLYRSAVIGRSGASFVALTLILQNFRVKRTREWLREAYEDARMCSSPPES